MKLFTADIQKKWDRHTVEAKSQRPLDLMELAADLCVQTILESEYFGHYLVVCGIGNNGGDGLAIACLLRDAGMVVNVLIAGSADQGTPEFKANLKRVMDTDIPVRFHTMGWSIDHRPETVIIDCIFGVGLNRPVEGIHADAIMRINMSQCDVISVDVPSGMFSDWMMPQQGPIVKAKLTIALHSPKRAFMFPENEEFIGRMQIVSLLLDDVFEAQNESDVQYYEWLNAYSDYIPRPLNTYKNKLGHGLIIGGSMGKMGAVLLSAEACMRSGAGLCTMHIPSHALTIAQVSLREAMISCDPSADYVSKVPDLQPFQAIGIGPGLGQATDTGEMLQELIQSTSIPMVIDADALNLIASKRILSLLPPLSIITPHPGEFDRLFGPHTSSFERVRTMRQMAQIHQLVIVLKGHYTAIATPDGQIYFNGSGVKGLATAGAGDVLTGIITGLLCQGYAPECAARFGVFLHGEAGNQASFEMSVETMLASDIIHNLSKPFSQLNEFSH